MPEDLSPEAQWILERLKAAKQAQHADHADVLEVLARARAVLTELGTATTPQRLPGRHKYRQLVHDQAEVLARTIATLVREIDPK